ncbi:MAG TPA: hypothetical protein ENN19_02070 [Chloroflexi bacterium]|nr:hypothetical protein [Chloroflexota bacterium]
MNDRRPNGSADQLERIGMVARWQPVHRGHAAILRALCACAAQAMIGIGSANRHDARNPFSLEETSDMIRLVLDEHENYTLVPVPDLDDGPRWRAMLVDLLGPLDLFVTDNAYVASLLAGDYRIARPIELVPTEARVAVDGTMVRREMAKGDGWRELVPQTIGDYIADGQLDERFRHEFGLQVLATDVMYHIARSSPQ